MNVHGRGKKLADMRQLYIGYSRNSLSSAIFLMSLSLAFLSASLLPCQALTLSNVDGTWSGATPSYASCLRYSNTADTSDENKVAYGSSDSCPTNLDFNVQSGFGFDGSSSQEILPGSIINLGRFRHHNRPIYANYILSSVKLSVTL
jgi:hypothetical protein